MWNIECKGEEDDIRDASTRAVAKWYSLAVFLEQSPTEPARAWSRFMSLIFQWKAIHERRPKWLYHVINIFRLHKGVKKHEDTICSVKTRRRDDNSTDLRDI